MTEPGFTDDPPWPGEWFEDCTCGHPWMMHDVDSLDGDNPSCCYETCPCGPGSYFVDQTTGGFAKRLESSMKRHAHILDRLDDSAGYAALEDNDNG